VQLVRAGRVLQTRPACHDDPPFDRIQFLGRSAAFVYQSDCLVPSADVYAVDPAGTGLQQLTKTPFHEWDPALSPDRSRVAYVREPIADRCDGCAQSIWVTSPTTQLTHPQETDDAPFDDSPSWSPDGSQLVFDQSGPDTPFSLLTVPPSGGTPKPLGIPGERPVWGPRLIAFEVDGVPPKLETYDPATHAVSVVATTTGRDPIALTWSGDGRLAYLADTGKDQLIAIVGGASFDVSKLLPKNSVASGLAWSPDGTQFAIVAKDANGLGEVWVLGADGRGLRQVTRNLDAVGNLSWR
jgi:Tol biopolymer transport system component